MIGSKGGGERPVWERGQWRRETEGVARTVGKLSHKKNEAGGGARPQSGSEAGGDARS